MLLQLSLFILLNSPSFASNGKEILTWCSLQKQTTKMCKEKESCPWWYTVSVPLSKVSLPQESSFALCLSVCLHNPLPLVLVACSQLCLKGLPIATVLEESVYHSSCLTPGWQDVRTNAERTIICKIQCQREVVFPYLPMHLPSSTL